MHGQNHIKLILTVFCHSNGGYENAHHCYVMRVCPLLFEVSASEEILALFQHTFLTSQAILLVSAAFLCWFDMQNGRLPNPVLGYVICQAVCGEDISFL